MNVFLAIIVSVAITWALTAYVTHRRIARMKRRYMALTQKYDDAIAALNRGDVKRFQELEAEYWIDSVKLERELDPSSYARPHHPLP